MKLILIWTILSVAARAACVEVPSDRIAARDLFDRVPQLREIPGDITVGFAPLPGTERIVSGRELALIAGRHGIIVGGLPDVCVVRALHSIAPGEMQAALSSALGIPDAEIEILDFSSQPLPVGRLEFQRSSLNQPPPNAPEVPVIWRGRLIYDRSRSVALWAKVRIAVNRAVFLAAEDIPAGSILHAGQIQASTARGFPFAGPVFASVSEIAGKVARRSIRAGQRLTAGALAEANDVVRGDIVQVRVMDGSATLSFDGIAATSGKKGDTILVRNSASGRNFRAVVDEKGKAVVRPNTDD